MPTRSPSTDASSARRSPPTAASRWGTRDADERHATLRATIGWSHDLLDDREQMLFARLSIFAAGCTLESAEARVQGGELDLWDAVAIALREDQTVP